MEACDYHTTPVAPDETKVIFLSKIRHYRHMFVTLIQQVFNWESAMVFIPLAFGLAVGLGYAIISAARHKRT